MLPSVSWLEPLLLQPAPTRGVEYDPEARTLGLYFDFDSPRREVWLAPRAEAVKVGVLELEQPAVCPDCRKAMTRAIGRIALTWPDDIRCEPCHWNFTRYYCRDVEWLRRMEAERARAATQQALERRKHEEEYRAAMGLRPLAVAGGRGRR